MIFINFALCFVRDTDIIMPIPQSNFHMQERGQKLGIRWSVRSKRRLLRRILVAVEGLTEVWLRSALSTC